MRILGKLCLRWTLKGSADGEKGTSYGFPMLKEMFCQPLCARKLLFCLFNIASLSFSYFYKNFPLGNLLFSLHKCHLSLTLPGISEQDIDEFRDWVMTPIWSTKNYSHNFCIHDLLENKDSLGTYLRGFMSIGAVTHRYQHVGSTSIKADTEEREGELWWLLCTQIYLHQAPLYFIGKLIPNILTW